MMTEDSNLFGEQCSIDGCSRPRHLRGWCDAHYTRWRRHGDPLAGGTPQGEPQRWLQDVAFTHQDPGPCLTWPYGKGGDGYGTIRIGRKMKKVTRLLCEHRNGPPPTPKHEAAHRCGKGHEGCVNQWHLDWKTTKENHADKVEHGTSQRGERAGGAKLTEAGVHEIRRLLAAGLTQAAVADRFGVHFVTINQIAAGRRWAWLADE